MSCKCKRKFSNRRRNLKPLFDGPIPDNPEYREMVRGILKDKRRRDIIEAYRQRPVETMGE